MSQVIEPSALWQALQDVDDGQEPAEVYARVMNEVDDTETIEEELFHETDNDHDSDACAVRHEPRGLGYCPGIICIRTTRERLSTNCPCKCHEGETDVD